MKRRNFINATALTGLGVALTPLTLSAKPKKTKRIRGTFSQTDFKFN